MRDLTELPDLLLRYKRVAIKVNEEWNIESVIKYISHLFLNKNIYHKIVWDQYKELCIITHPYNSAINDNVLNWNDKGQLSTAFTESKGYTFAFFTTNDYNFVFNKRDLSVNFFSGRVNWSIRNKDNSYTGEEILTDPSFIDRYVKLIALNDTDK